MIARAPRGRSWLAACCLLSLAGEFGACSQLSDVAPDECGNGVVETSIEEDCDTVEQLSSADPEKPSLCAEPGDPNACHYVWDDEHNCPVGWRAGQDKRCRRPSGLFGPAEAAVPEVRGRRPQIADIDKDGQLDVMVDSIDGLATLGFYLERGEGGSTVGAGFAAEPRASLGDLTGDGLADVISTIELSSSASSPSEGLTGILVRRGNAARTDDLRTYPGPTHFPGDVVLVMVPFGDVDGPTTPDLDYANAIYWDYAKSCGHWVCIKREYFGAPEPLSALVVNGRFGVSEYALSKASIASSRRIAAMAVPGTPDFTIFENGEPPMSSGFSLPGFTVNNVGGMVVGKPFADDYEVARVMRSAATWVFATFTGNTDPKADSVPSLFGTVDALDSQGGPAFAHINSDAYVDIVISGASESELNAAWKRGGVFLSYAAPQGDLFSSHVIGAGAGLDVATARWTKHALGDVDGDGLSDVAAAFVAGTTPGVEIVLGGDLLPLASSRIVIEQDVKQVAVGDLDGDGLDDIVIAIGSSGVAACSVPDEIQVAYGRASGFPEPFVRVGALPGVTQLISGRFELPADGAGDIGIASRCMFEDGTLDRRTTILHGSSERQPYAPFILNAGTRPRRVLVSSAPGAVAVVESGQFGFRVVPVLGDAELDAKPFEVAGDLAQAVEPLAVVGSPSGAFALASLTEGRLRLDALRADADAIAPVGEPAELLEVPVLSQRAPHWSLATLPGEGGGAATLAAVALQDIADQDGDGASDVADNCPTTPNLDQSDQDLDLDGDACDVDDDGDGVLDAFDNCPKVPNFDQADLDEDHLGDLCDLDADGDGLSFSMETVLGTDPLNRDSDLDSIDDGIEVGSELDPENSDLQLPIDALDADSDNDGIPDLEEAGPGTFPRDRDGDLLPDYRDTDSDADTVPDSSDNCRLIANTSQVDADTNGVGDACENLVDGDFDTIPDLLDNCVLVANIEQVDIDNDGVGQACDVDDDNDFITDDVDNCPTLPADDQADTDEDGFGDVCDDDDDDDQVFDIQDNCPSQQNVDQLNADGDLWGDACDDVSTQPQASRYSVFALVPWQSEGELGEPLAIGLPPGSLEFVDVVVLQGLDLEPILYVATEENVFEVACTTGALPTCDGGEPTLTLMSTEGPSAFLSASHISGLASGDFTGDGIDDLLIIDDDGARVVPQLPL